MAYIVQVPMWVPFPPGSAPPQHLQQPTNMLPPYSQPQAHGPAPPQQPPLPPPILSPIAEASSKLPPQLNAARLPFPHGEHSGDELASKPRLDMPRNQPQQLSPMAAQQLPQPASLPPPQLLAQHSSLQGVPDPNFAHMSPMVQNMGQPMGQPGGQPAGQPVAQLAQPPPPAAAPGAQYQLMDPSMQHRRGSYMGMFPMNGMPVMFDQLQLHSPGLPPNAQRDRHVPPPPPQPAQPPPAPQYFYAPLPPQFALEGGVDHRAYRSSVSSNGSVPDLDSSMSSASSNESSSPGNSPDLPSKKPYVTSSGVAPIRLAPLRQNSDAQPLPQLAKPQIENLQQKRGSDAESTPAFSRLPGRPAGSGRIGKQPVRDPIKLKHRVWLQQNRIYQDKLHNAGFRVLEGTNGTKKCSLCQKHFAKEMFVWRHALSHVDEKPFHCTVCDQKFTRSDTLQRHVRRAGHLGAACK